MHYTRTERYDREQIAAKLAEVFDQAKTLSLSTYQTACALPLVGDCIPVGSPVGQHTIDKAVKILEMLEQVNKMLGDFEEEQNA